MSIIKARSVRSCVEGYPSHLSLDAPITTMAMENIKVYCAHGILRPFMTELVVNLSSSNHRVTL